jgi:uncharacterized SAM-binding protein YcdF (DUF218 family)
LTYLDPLLPSLLAVFVLALGLGWRRLGWVRWVLAAGCLGLFLSMWLPFAHLCAYSLEGRYPYETPYPPETNYDAIVVLSAGATPPVPWEPEAVIGPGTYVRCQHAAWLYKNAKAVPVLVSGGRVPRSDDAPVSYADLMRLALIEKGVPAEQVWIEPESRNTYENALFSARILRERGIGKVALVTEAFHMPRAVACFRKQGVSVVAAPTGFLTPTSYAWLDFVPRSGGVNVMDVVIHEWVGLAWYRLAGRI